MFDKELIEKVCNLTCTKAEVVRNQTTIKYDTDHPFKKYYNFATIKGAIKKYILKEWDDQTLSHWACIYCWILDGGYEENIRDDLNDFEVFMNNIITWDLDGLSFFDAEYDLDDETNIHTWLKDFRHYDHIWKTRDDWKAVFAVIGECDEENGAQYVALFNDKTKEYMIIYSDFLENGCSNEYFKYITREEFINQVEQLKEKNYTILSCAEKHYYEELQR